MKRRRLALLLVLLIGVLGAGLWFVKERRAAPTLYVADSLGGLQAVMQAAGELGDLPYRISWSRFATASGTMEALDARAVDIGPLGDAPFIFARAAGSDVKLIAAWRSGVAGTAILVRPDTRFDHVADLVGKTICTTRGSTGHFLVLRAFGRAGLPLNAFRLVSLPPADCKAALANGAVDAWATWGPNTALAESTGSVKVVERGPGLSTGLGLIGARQETIDAKRAMIADFVQRLGRAREWAVHHDAAFARTVSDETKLPLDIARLYTGREATRMVPVSRAVVDDLQLCADLFARIGLLKGSPSMGDAIARNPNSKE